MATLGHPQFIRIATQVALLAFGLAFMAIAMSYGLGTLNNFGPGFFPFLFALCLVGATAADLVQSVKAPDRTGIQAVSLRRVVLVIASLVSFGVLLKPAGFVPAVFVATVLAMRADSDVGWLLVLLYALGLTVFGYLLFLRLLGIPLTAFW